MAEVEQLAASSDALLTCSICNRLLCEAVQLKCLHNCCRQCFSTAALESRGEGVSCVACGSVTHDGSEQPNGFVDGQVQRYRAIAESRMCGVCKANGEHDKPAMVWCAACRHSLCGDCISAHRQYNRQHVTQSLEELSSLDEVCTKPSPSACAIHKKPLEVACGNCEQAKCISCWAECHEKKHETHVAGKESFDNYVGKFISSIAAVESELLRKSEVLQKPKILLRDTKAARDCHLREISARKRLVVDAVDMVYQEIELSTKNVYDDIEAEGLVANTVAERIDADLSDARNYIRRLVESDQKCEIINQQKVVRERLSALSADLDSLSERLAATKREVKIEASMPDDVGEVVRAWIGKHPVHAASSSAAPSQLSTQQQQQQLVSSPPPQQQQQQRFSFGAASVSIKLPVQCADVALTQDGRSLLLAAWENGMIELSSADGRELSRWRPPKYSSWEGSRDDEVLAVATLSDGQAAVSLHRAQLVVLLRRSEKSNCSKTSTAGGAAAAVAANDDAWIADCRLDLQLQFSPRLSAHGDVLAASSGHQLQLMSVRSGRRLSDALVQREYWIGSLTVAAHAVVTGSNSKVELGGGRRAAYVLDAHSLDADDKRLWRYVLSSESEQEELEDICTDSSGGCLYAAVCKSDKSSSRVSALNLADGSELRRVALSFSSAAAASQPLLLPWRLSLCDDGASAEQQSGSSSNSSCCGSGRALLLAALCLDSVTKQWKTVTLHCGTNDMLQ